MIRFLILKMRGKNREVIDMIHVLFVCLGNICRSPMAEAVFSDMVKKNGLNGQINIDSAGLGAWHAGNPPHEGTKEILKKKGISASGITARQVRESDLTDFDYVIAMDAENIGHLRSMAGYKKRRRVLQGCLIMYRSRTLRTCPIRIIPGISARCTLWSNPGAVICWRQ